MTSRFTPTIVTSIDASEAANVNFDLLRLMQQYFDAEGEWLYSEYVGPAAALGSDYTNCTDRLMLTVYND